jgi:hypothetical protein
MKLDELTMPKHFWEESANDSEPNDGRLAYLTEEDLWKLRNKMVFYSTYLTVVATFVAVVSLLLILLPLSPREVSEDGADRTTLLMYTCILLQFPYH